MELAYITSAFFRPKQVEEMYGLFAAAARAQGVTPVPSTNAEVAVRLQNNALKAPFEAALFYDKDLAAAQALEMGGCRVFNTSRAIGLADDKALTALTLTAAGIPAIPTYCVPKTYAGVGYTNLDFVRDVSEFCGGFPLVMKHRRGSLGTGVFLVKNEEELKALLRNGTEEWIAQPFRRQNPAGTGCDLRINVVGGKLNNAIRRVNEGDFRSNIAARGNAEPITPPAEAVTLAVAGAKALGLDFAGCDIMTGPDGYEICEINSNALTLGAYHATGVNAFTAIVAYVKECMKWN